MSDLDHESDGVEFMAAIARNPERTLDRPCRQCGAEAEQPCARYCGSELTMFPPPGD